MFIGLTNCEKKIKLCIYKSIQCYVWPVIRSKYFPGDLKWIGMYALQTTNLSYRSENMLWVVLVTASHSCILQPVLSFIFQKRLDWTKSLIDASALACFLSPFAWPLSYSLPLLPCILTSSGTSLLFRNHSEFIGLVQFLVPLVPILLCIFSIAFPLT